MYSPSDPKKWGQLGFGFDSGVGTMCIRLFCDRGSETLDRRRSHELEMDIFSPGVDTSRLPLDNEQWVLKNTVRGGQILLGGKMAQNSHCPRTGTPHSLVFLFFFFFLRGRSGE